MLFERLLSTISSATLVDVGPFTWGLNTNYQLGFNDTTLRSSLSLVTVDIGFDDISAGTLSSAYILNGELYTCGSNTAGVTGQNTSVGNTIEFKKITDPNFTNWFFVSVGSDISAGIRSTGQLYTWGNNSTGSTGQGTTSGFTLKPTIISTPNFSDWFFVSMGTSVGHAIRGSGGVGALYGWGNNNPYGVPGLGTTSGSTSVPTQVGSDVDWTWVSTSLEHANGIRNGRLYGWGNGANTRNATGVSSSTPQQAGAFTDWQMVSCGRAWGLGIRGGGLLYGWGFNGSGAIGQPTTGNYAVTQIGTFTDWVWCSTGNNASVGIRSDGSLYTWGNSINGNTANGTTTGLVMAPVKIGTLNGWQKAKFHPFGDHAIALRT